MSQLKIKTVKLEFMRLMKVQTNAQFVSNVILVPLSINAVILSFANLVLDNSSRKTVLFADKKFLT